MDRRSFPFILSVVLSAIAIAIAALLGTDFEERLLLAARYTARASFPLFLIAYSASALLRLWPNDWTKPLVRHRRQWGLAFAFAHTVHLAALGWFNIFIANMPGLQALAGGGLAYGLMFVMAATSNNASMKALGIWWKRIHIAGIHWLWFVFTVSYLGRLYDPERWMQGAVFFPLCLAALSLRIAAWAKARRARAPTSPAA
jgi:DMSO/TMAO reductase YedYZ heme-binding membrane subunit